MGNTTAKITKDMKDAAGAVQHTAEKGTDAAVRAVAMGKAVVTRGAEKVQDKTALAADQSKEA